MKKNKINIRIAILLISAILIGSCSTKKKGYFNRKYHDITAKYNGYFNGKESLKYGIIKLEKAHIEDYSNFLPIYKTDQITKSKAHRPYMDKSIQKGSIVIQKHSINIRKKEYCKWIDDSYFLVARAYFYKGEFLEAKKTFDFITKNYKKTELAELSKLWTARCYIEMTDYYSAETILDELRAKRKFPENLQKELHLVFADLYLKQNFYSDAVDELKSACNLIKRKAKKARFYYIIAQVYQDAGNIKQSKKYFEFVLNSNPEYEMVFNAKMNLARSLRDKKDLNQMKQSLLKMLKDEKNIDYLDQIYFTLAEIHLVEKDTSLAIENYIASTKHSLENDLQKSLAFLQLGRIYYNDRNYPSAKIFYDSAYIFMPEDHLKYTNVKQTQEVLEKLITNLNTISLQDSLQYLAGLSDSERRSIIQSVIKKLIEKEQEELREKQNRVYSGHEGRNRRNENFGENVSGGKWYFYNPATLSFGMSEFRKIWGKRKLEDDWRRSNKKSLSTIEGDSVSEKNSIKNSNNNLKSEQYYLDQIPLTAGDLQISNNKIMNAYYQSSIIYKEDLNEIEESEKMLESLVKRFPKNNELTPRSYYLLYLSQIERSIDKANKTKQQLISSFPESNYAKTLIDTSYISSILEEINKKEQEYSKIFLLYQSAEYLKVIDATFEKINLLGDESKYKEKYYLINILAKFKEYNDTSSFILNLKKGVNNYPNTETSKRCNDILSLINNPEEMNRRNEIAVLKSPYRHNENGNHYIIIITPKENTDANYIKTLISDFNAKNFSNEIIEINAMLLGMENHLIIIKTFKNKSTSSYYHDAIFSNKEVLNELNKTPFLKFIISEENFPEFYKRKDVDGYTNFYKNKYIEKN